ncbi:MAG: HDED protein [Isosphaera sp.]|nr:HDED protein [Isosphaera sp.]
MNALLNLSALFAEEREMLRRNWGWFVALGVLFVAAGVAGLAFVGLTTLFTVVFVGWCFLVSGVVGVVHAVVRKGWSGFLLDLLSGLLTAVAGLFILLHPAQGASVLTVVVGAVFLAGGLLRLVAGVGMRNPYAGWFVLHGVVSALLGVMVLVGWPESSVWVIGTLVAIDLLFEGFRLVSFGLAVKNLPEAEPGEYRPGQAAAPTPPV